MPQQRQPSFDELTPKELLRLSRVTPTTELPPMQPLFQLFDVPCFYRGELVAVCGKAKSGKTLFLSVVMGSALSHTDGSNTPTDNTDNSTSCLDKDLPNQVVNEEICEISAICVTESKPLKVLWIDTEQSQQSTQDIMVNRILPLARGQTPDHTDSTDIDERFYAYNLRGLGFEKRKQLMELAIATVMPDLVVIDGIKDLVTDINDAVQATLIMEQLMALAQKHHCCIVNVLHQNKSEADHNMRGSIGTELTNKAFEVYNCEYIEDRNLFRVSQRLSRRNRVKRKLCYRLNDDGLPVECPEVQDQPRDAQGRWTTNKSPTNGAAGSVLSMSPADLRKLFTDAMEGRRQRAFNELMAIALKRCGVVDAKAYYAYVSEAEEQGIIRKVVHPETGRTWVELIDNALPF